MKSKINLHMHSNKSLDGSESPTELLNQCEDAGISITAITDHDTCEAYKNIESSRYSGQLITGIEMNAMVGKETFDILCYGFKLEEVSAWVKKQYGTVAYRQTKIFNKLVEKCKELKLEILGFEEYDGEKEYAHATLFRLLSNSKKGREFLKQYNINKTGDLYRVGTMQEDFPLYIDMHLVWPDITEVRELIHKNGGKIFLAHPYRYGEIDVDSALQSCTPYIDGIEVYNNPETEEQVIYLYNYAKTHNLLMSAGSDYHGLNHRYHNKIDVFLNSNIEQGITSWTKKYQKQKDL